MLRDQATRGVAAARMVPKTGRLQSVSGLGVEVVIAIEIVNMESVSNWQGWRAGKNSGKTRGRSKRKEGKEGIEEDKG